MAVGAILTFLQGQLLAFRARRWSAQIACVLFLLIVATWGSSAWAQDDSAESTNLELTESEGRWLEEHRELTVAYDRHFPPYSYEDEHGDLQGYAVDTFQLIAKRTGITFVPAPHSQWDELYQAAQAQEVDVVATMVDRPERREWFSFTRPYIQKSLVIVTRTDDRRIVTRENLAEKRLVVVKGYQYVARVRSEFPSAELLERGTMLDALNAVAVGSADAAITFLGAAHHVRNRYMMTNLRLAAVYDARDSAESIAVGAEQLQLRSILDKALRSIDEEEKQELRGKYFPADPPREAPKTLTLTEEEKAWLEEHPVIRVGIDPEFHPFEFFDEEGVHRGYSAEYIGLLNQRMGINLSVVPQLPWKDVTAKAKERQIDVLAAVGKTAERSEYLRFSSPYLDFQRVVITQSDAGFIAGLEDLKQMRVAVQANSSHDGFLKDNTDLEPIRYPTLQESLLAVSEGEVDAFVGNVAANAYWIRRLNLDNLKVAGPASHEVHTLQFAVRDDWPELVGIINKGLASVTDEEREEIASRWVVLKYEPRVDYSLIWKLGGGASALLVLVLVWNWRTRREKALADKLRQRAETAQKELEQTNEELVELRDNLAVAVAEKTEELVQAERKFHQAQKMEALGTLVGGIAHDFNNVLTGMLGAIYLTQQELEGEVKENLALANELGLRGAKMIEQLLAFARKEDTTKVRVDVGAFLESVVSVLGTSFPSCVDLRVENQCSGVSFVGNAPLIEQVLLNIANNARDAVSSQEEAVIQIRTRQVVDDVPPGLDGGERYVVFEIEDNGSGIEPDQLERIFDPFFTTKPPGEGTGLGLAMAHTAVQDHGGTITVGSSPKGTTFSVFVPAWTSAHETDSVPARVEKGEGERVLLADDDPVVLQVHQSILEQIGYRVVVARDGVEAVHEFERSPDDFSIAILDIVMPKRDGISAAAHMRKERPELKVLFLSGYDSGRALHSLLSRDKQGLLGKPATVEQLSSTIRRMLQEGVG